MIKSSSLSGGTANGAYRTRGSCDGFGGFDRRYPAEPVLWRDGWWWTVQRAAPDVGGPGRRHKHFAGMELDGQRARRCLDGSGNLKEGMAVRLARFS